MWKPPERIKHSLPDTAWPTAVEAAASHLFSPLRVGPIALAERTWVPAMVPWRATEEGFVSEQALAWYERFARGQPGALVVEATGIREVPSGPLLRIGDDRYLPGLQRLVETVRAASGGRTRLLIQLIDFLNIRRRPEPEKFFRRYLRISDRHRRLLGPGVEDEEIRQRLAKMAPAALEEILDARELEALRQGYRERVTDVDLPHIRTLPRTLPDVFAAAAVRAEQAGFDGVELHYAHAYTMASFLSRFNTRGDGYGASLEGRIRLPLEVFRAVRQAVAPSFAVGCRLLSEDCLPGGSSVEDAAFFCRQLARAGMDFLSLSRGGKFEDAKQPKIGRAAYPYTGPSGYECMPTAISDRKGPFGRNLAPARQIRQSLLAAGLKTPIVVSGGLATFAQAEALLRRGDGDVVGAARQSLADPDWFLKMRLGLGGEVRRCTYTNYCEGLDQMHKEVTCRLWDREGLPDSSLERSKDGKRRLLAPAWKRGEGEG